MSRVLCWFSCGDASAVAAKLAIEKYGDRCEVLYCDTFAYEHPDNRRFFSDVEGWLGVKIKILKSEKYTDIYDVFEKTRFLVSAHGARCTTELKKNLRTAYQTVDDLHIFGFTSDEINRVTRFNKENPDLLAEFPLVDNCVTKSQCHARIREAGIEIPAMYKLGYKNNNCRGCVKGGMGYWNRIRIDWPEIFAKMATVERDIGVSICRKEYPHKQGEKRKSYSVFLDELPPDAGVFDEEPDIECGVLCIHGTNNESK